LETRAWNWDSFRTGLIAFGFGFHLPLLLLPRRLRPAIGRKRGEGKGKKGRAFHLELTSISFLEIFVPQGTGWASNFHTQRKSARKEKEKKRGGNYTADSSPEQRYAGNLDPGPNPSILPLARSGMRNNAELTRGKGGRGKKKNASPGYNNFYENPVTRINFFVSFRSVRSRGNRKRGKGKKGGGEEKGRGGRALSLLTTLERTFLSILSGAYRCSVLRPPQQLTVNFSHISAIGRIGSENGRKRRGKKKGKNISTHNISTRIHRHISNQHQQPQYFEPPHHNPNISNQKEKKKREGRKKLRTKHPERTFRTPDTDPTLHPNISNPLSPQHD